jgi:dephospho-CoA kinase
VAAEPDIVIERVKSRDGLSEEDIRSRIANQMSLAEKKALASRVIDNSTDLSHLYAQLDEALANI